MSFDTGDKSGSFSVLDFEGTSKTSKAMATEIGLVRLNDALEPQEEFETVLRPPIKPLKESMSYARLSMGEINSAPTFREVWPQISKFFSGSVVVAHNKIYEIGVIKNELSVLGEDNCPPFICTLEWSRKIIGSRLNSHTLGRMCSYFDIPLDNAHEAIADARATAVLFRKLMELSLIIAYQPVQRGLDFFSLNPGPTFIEPPLGILIVSIADKCLPLSIGDQ